MATTVTVPPSIDPRIIASHMTNTSVKDMTEHSPAIDLRRLL